MKPPRCLQGYFEYPKTRLRFADLVGVSCLMPLTFASIRTSESQRTDKSHISTSERKKVSWAVPGQLVRIQHLTWFQAVRGSGEAPTHAATGSEHSRSLPEGSCVSPRARTRNLLSDYRTRLIR